MRRTVDEGSQTQGLSWSWELDFDALLAALSEPAPWNRPAVDLAGADAVDPAGAEFAEPLEAMDQGRVREVPLTEVAGRIAESLPTGPDLAGWLATSSPSGLEDGALAGMATAYRRLASWAQAGELAVVAELASRSAAADDQIGVGEDGRPAKLPDEACAQVSLALTMSHASASWWSDLAVTLKWRLTATGAALAAGQIDLGRARLIADATAALDDETARAVEAKILSGAGDKTTAQLRAALRRAVIAADPQGAERRREEAERRAKVSLYPDHDGTASLAGYSLPSISAAAAMARITALARAMKAAGAGGGIDLLRAQVFLGLLLGTLPYIPPAADAPPDSPPDSPPDDDAPDSPPAVPPEFPPDDPQDSQPEFPRDDPDPGDHQGGLADRAPPAASGGYDSDLDAASRDGPDRGGSWSGPPPAWPRIEPSIPPGPGAMGGLLPAEGGLIDVQVPWSTLTGDSGEPGYLSRIGPITGAQARELAGLAARDAAVRWRVIVTDTKGRTQAVAFVGRGKTGAGSSPGLVRRVTLTICKDTLNMPDDEDLPTALRRALRSAVQAGERAAQRAAVDAAAAGGCAHEQESPGYRPPPTLREFITARDVTCRFPTCRQPAWRCDLDHSVPYHLGGRTCACNLGGLCRFHHQIKQHRRWELLQQTPGTFVWTTPAGRVYSAEPDRYAA